MGLERENLITKINYSARAREIVALGITTPFALAALVLDRSKLPNISIGVFEGHALDFFGGLSAPILFRAVAGDIIKNRIYNAITGCVTVSGSEFSQLIGGQGIDPLEKATFDPKDFIAYGVGVLAWYLVDYSAKKLYDSGLTRPLYRVLHIRDRRVFGEIQSPKQPY